MKLTAKLAYSQLKTNRKRTVWTLSGIVLSAAMLMAVCGFVASAKKMIEAVTGINKYSAAHTAALVSLGALFGAIIVFASVVVVSNAFRVSAAERTKQFGILKSVGATKWQIAQTILYEGIFLSVIAIPIGLALGLLIEFIGAFVVTNLLNLMSAGGALTVEMSMPFVITGAMFAVAILTSFGTVLLSAWLPARKAAKISAISAIRQSGEVKIKRGKVKTSKLTQKLFGFEGMLAAKSLKRSRRNFRATVVSLTVSIVLLIVASSFGGLMSKVTNLMYPNIDATAVGQFSGSYAVTYADYADYDSDAPTYSYMTIDTGTAELIAEKLGEYPGAAIFGVGSSPQYTVELSEGVFTEAVLLTVDEKHYAELCKIAGVPLGSNILVNRRVEITDGGKRREYTPWNFSEVRGKSITLTGGAGDLSIAISGELTGADVPTEVAYQSVADFSVIVPECSAISYRWFANVPDAVAFSAYAEPIISELSPKERNGLTVWIDCSDIAGETALVKHITNVMMFFVYGFVGMLALIALTNVISTIGANVRSRSGEFAVLQSVGMTKGGLARMLNLESVLCSARSLLYGVPLGIIGAYAAYRAMGLAAEVEFSFPWLAVAECALGVFAVTWVTMRYAASRLRGGSIINAIRTEGGI